MSEGITAWGLHGMKPKFAFLELFRGQQRRYELHLQLDFLYSDAFSPLMASSSSYCTGSLTKEIVCSRLWIIYDK